MGHSSAGNKGHRLKGFCSPIPGKSQCVVNEWSNGDPCGRVLCHWGTGPRHCLGIA